MIRTQSSPSPPPGGLGSSPKVIKGGWVTLSGHACNIKEKYREDRHVVVFYAFLKPKTVKCIVLRMEGVFRGYVEGEVCMFLT